MAIKKDYFPNIFIVFKVHEHFFIFYYFVISTAWIVNGNQIFKKQPYGIQQAAVSKKLLHMQKDTHSAKQKELLAKKTFTPLTEATIKAAAKGKMSDFYFLNNVLDLMSYELLCHQPYYESFTFSHGCSFCKASPMIDFEEALNHLLSIVPLSLLNVYGSVCKKSKNKRNPILMSKSDNENADASKENLMAMMRVVTSISESFEDLALKLISILPN